MDSNRPNKRNSHRRNRNRRSNRIAQQIVQQIIRISCCWNCFQFGHTRHQCPHPREVRCSYCRLPGVQTMQCKCNAAISHRRSERNQLQPPLIQNSLQNEIFDSTVMVPNINENSYEEQENLVVLVDNQNEEEFLQIDLEEDTLDEN